MKYLRWIVVAVLCVAIVSTAWAAETATKKAWRVVSFSGETPQVVR